MLLVIISYALYSYLYRYRHFIFIYFFVSSFRLIPNADRQLFEGRLLFFGVVCINPINQSLSYCNTIRAAPVFLGPRPMHTHIQRHQYFFVVFARARGLFSLRRARFVLYKEKNMLSSELAITRRSKAPLPAGDRRQKVGR